MALIIKDRVLETCSSPGSGSVTLLGAVTGYQSFNAAVGNGNTCYYAIADQNGNNWEVGVGTFTAPATLARTTVLASSNGGSVVNFSSGTQNVFLTYPASKAVTTDTLAYPPAIGGTTPAAGTFTVLTATADSAFTSTGALQISKGTTGEQPGSPVTGMLRYNTSTNTFEGYSGASPSWSSLGGISIVNDTTTATAIYPLLSSATTGSVGTQYTSNSKLLYVPSTGKFTSTILNGGSVTSDSGVQIGTNATATNNMTWYQPASPDGTVRLGVGNVGVTTSDRITVSGTTTTLAGTTNVGTLDVSTLIDLPSWTTGTRPGSPTAGMTGYNSTIGRSETYNGSVWVASGTMVQQAVQTGNFNAVSGNSYPVNTTSGPVTATLPASPTVGDQINIFDYAGTAATNNITVNPNGLNIIGSPISAIISGTRSSLTFQYVDSTQGWTVVSDGTSSLYYQAVTVTYGILSGGGGGGFDNSGIGVAGGGAASTYRTGSASLLRNNVYTVTVGGGGGTFGTGGGSSVTGTAVSVSAPAGAGGKATSGSYPYGGSNADYSGAYGGAGAGASSGGKDGGNGATVTITGSSQVLGGGGAGYQSGGGNVGTGSNGAGSGSGGSGFLNSAGSGSSGVVYISIPTSAYTGTTTGSPTVTTSGSNTILRYLNSGSYTA
jgi:hypothetical protein